mmetsp:Transcript_27679/g.82620  ORF Transcript_27679/g.82620 Transcript_27679/m.82620 type:complete len:441 (+) Transcript_27679:675-1997(+)
MPAHQREDVGELPPRRVTVEDQPLHAEVAGVVRHAAVVRAMPAEEEREEPHLGQHHRPRQPRKLPEAELPLRRQAVGQVLQHPGQVPAREAIVEPSSDDGSVRQDAQEAPQPPEQGVGVGQQVQDGQRSLHDSGRKPEELCEEVRVEASIRPTLEPELRRQQRERGGGVDAEPQPVAVEGREALRQARAHVEEPHDDAPGPAPGVRPGDRQHQQPQVVRRPLVDVRRAPEVGKQVQEDQEEGVVVQRGHAQAARPAGEEGVGRVREQEAHCARGEAVGVVDSGRHRELGVLPKAPTPVQAACLHDIEDLQVAQVVTRPYNPGDRVGNEDRIAGTKVSKKALEVVKILVFVLGVYHAEWLLTSEGRHLRAREVADPVARRLARRPERSGDESGKGPQERVDRAPLTGSRGLAVALGHGAAVRRPRARMGALEDGGPRLHGT